MGKLAIQLSLLITAIAMMMVIPCFFLGWAQAKAIGPQGTSDALFSLFFIKVRYSWSIQEAYKATGKVASTNPTTAAMFADCQKNEGIFGQEMRENECVFWTSDLYLSRDATSEFVRLFGMNDVLGQAWQMSIVFWVGALNTLLLVVALVCGCIGAAYLYFYMEGKFNPKLRKIGSYYIAGCALCLFLSLIFYIPVLMFQGMDSHGAVTRALPGMALLAGKGLVPSSSVFILFVALVLIGGALASQGSWKTESGEWKRERHKMKNEFAKWMDSSSSDDDSSDSDWSDDEYSSKHSKKKKSKKHRKH